MSNPKPSASPASFKNLPGQPTLSPHLVHCIKPSRGGLHRNDVYVSFHQENGKGDGKRTQEWAAGPELGILVCEVASIKGGREAGKKRVKGGKRKKRKEKNI